MDGVGQEEAIQKSDGRLMMGKQRLGEEEQRNQETLAEA